jgi:hypothetical protein
MKLTKTSQSILNTLLDRAEQPNRQTVIRVRLKDSEYPRYYSNLDFSERRDTNQQLAQLAQQGLLSLAWERFEEHNWLQTVDLIPEQLGALYKLLGRNPLAQQRQALHDLLAQQQPSQAWHRSFLEWAEQQLSAYRSVAPLKLDEPAHNRDLLAALHALGQLQTPTLERTLSSQIFANSKRLEALRSNILTILRRHDPHAHEYGDDDWALLRSHNLDRAPEYIALAGPLSLQIGSQQPVALDTLQPSMALSAASIPQISSMSSNARLLITVENATSFNELLMQRPAGCVLIYTGGFASPSLIALLRLIRAQQVPHAHWGDLDAGGLRILLHLREQLGPTKALAMNRESFEQHQQHSQKLSANDTKNLQQLHQQPLLSDCYDLIDSLLASQQKLEQEAMSITWLLTQAEFNT